MEKTTETELDLRLTPSSGDELSSPEYQAELDKLMQSLTANGIKFSVGRTLMESAMSSGFNLGQFSIIAGAIAPLATLLGVWLKGKYGRKVSVRTKDFSAQAGSPQEIEKILRLADKHKLVDKNQKKKKKKRRK